VQSPRPFLCWGPGACNNIALWYRSSHKFQTIPSSLCHRTHRSCQPWGGRFTRNFTASCRTDLIQTAAKHTIYIKTKEANERLVNIRRQFEEGGILTSVYEPIMADTGIDRLKVLRDAREEGRREDRKLSSLPKGHLDAT
jgi:hypothetical protein